MDEQLLILDRRIRKDLESIESIWKNLQAADLETHEDDLRETVFVAYQLHNLYNAAENMFRNIAGVFGNHLDDRKGWQAELLDRMRLDLTPLRPAVIDDSTFALLDELRRFRHIFRAAYTLELDRERLVAVLHKALILQRHLPSQLEDFLGFLEQIDP